MKKVRKSPMIPQALTDYVVANPNADWENFRNETANGYAVVKQQLTADQRGLCAYCEIDLHIHAQNGLDDFRVEHFHPKKPHNPPPNHALEWQNLLAVCTGGNIRDLEIRERFTSPDHSCDVPKANYNWTNQIFNPLTLPSFPRLFSFNENTGEILVDIKSCPDESRTVANETIKLLRLSAPRLNRLRQPVFEMLNARLQELVSNGFTIEAASVLIAEELLPEQESVSLPAFFTAIRWYLGEAAEQRLKTIGYDG